MRVLLLVCLISLPLAAGGDYETILAEAIREQQTLRPGDAPDSPLDRAYLRLAEAAMREPDRWEAFAARALNRCEKAVVCRQILSDLINEQRARNVAPEILQERMRRGVEFIELALREAYDDFRRMEGNMRRQGASDPAWTRFAGAAMKYAKGEYLETENGEPGAIPDFQELVRRRWQPERCSEFVAKSYIQLGVAAFAESRYPEAQEYWDKALKWARSPHTRRLILTNKAGAFEMDNEYGLAEKILREQIAREPNQPVHWKNLGLVLGFQNRLREALHAYARCRELCARASDSFPLALFHGNAWLKAAMIHGKLLEEDGDLRLAWRLFLEYRALFGDDYNFCFNFGDFAFHLGAYDLAWVFLERARDLQPFCPPPYQLLLSVAPRTSGTPQEVRERIEKAKEDFRLARERYLPREQSPGLKRLCGGLRDVGDQGRAPGRAGRIEPDPLAEWGADNPPEWVERVARGRKPFRPYDPAQAEPSGEQPQEPGEAPAGGEPPGPGLLPLASLAVLVLFAAFFFFRRR